MFTLNKSELYWAAGFFDGEGHVGSTHRNGRGPKGYAHVEISQAHPEVLHRFREAVGCGTVRGPYPRKDGASPMWYFDASNHQDVMQVREMIFPYLSSVKQRQFEAVLDGYEVRPYSKRRKDLSRVCLSCSVTFISRPNQQYCSVACRGAARSGRTGMVSHICECCGETFMEYAANHRRFCSKVCAYKHRKCVA